MIVVVIMLVKQCYSPLSLIRPIRRIATMMAGVVMVMGAGITRFL
ncbi:MAG: hypothetical protein PVI36_05490 [Desulfobacterales bacterium]